jgi:hypothetical protein
MPLFMAKIKRNVIPGEQLRRLDFLLGESGGVETMYLPGQPPVQFRASIFGSREACDRFLRVEFYGEIPGFGPESFQALITYSETLFAYRMWLFSSVQETPAHLTGNFNDDGQLVLLSDPTAMPWGPERLRYTISPLSDGSVEVLGELWQLDGYAKYCSVIFRPEEA